MIEAAAGAEQSQLKMINQQRTGKIAVGRGGKVFHESAKIYTRPL
jgi:hypothetical protein